ncbi:oleate hydratase [Clostridium sp. D2Q-11]|uniref:Oleate hydratase n=1 Tax=Anaeromonas frigoriresistens TaxID=2683708 RepID=A0A942ZA30_9FIRM|nr:oleate hydratase [Anaeromonas frigoriresistens]MBS4539420.1 oleate hydratase [Anaeromonas frigoriresistens]
MRNYERINTLKPKGIENKKAYLIGGGIASLAAAEYLIRDGHMEGKNITILEQDDIIGGALDGSGNAEDGYVARGGREMEEHYECMWDLFGEVPSLENPKRTVLDEFRELNIDDPNYSNCRAVAKRGEKLDFSSLGLAENHVKQLTKLFLVTEDSLGTITVEQFFDDSFLETDMWLYWRTMFAFETWHSVVEMKRYMHRFIHHIPGMSRMKGLVFTKYNQYDSMVLPLKKWLESQGVIFDLNTQVVDLDIDITTDKKTVTGIHLTRNGEKQEVIKTTENDLVFFTNGSMTENSTYGSMDKAPILDKSEGGCWSLWKKIAEKDTSFGNPEVFCGDIDKSKWESYTITSKGPKMRKLIEKFAERKIAPHKTVTGGIITIKDSSWLLSVTVNRQPQFIDQPDDVIVLWAYALFPDKKGDFIKKKMSDCTGRELLQELLYHLGIDEKDMHEYIDTSIVIPVMMPYITSQFMPRVKEDRPQVVPEGSTNLAFLGQFTEIEGDCVFTVEYSVRSAMIAVYTLLGLDKNPPEIYPSQYDIRVIADAVKTLNSGRPLPAEPIIKKLLNNTTLEGLI